MKWLHISDIHFNYSGYDSSNLKNKLLEKLTELNLDLDFILITGDCFYQYKGDMFQQKNMATFIKSIATKCKCPRNRIYLCQGNHDVNRQDNTRNNLIDSIRDGSEDFSKKYNELSETGSEKFQKLHKSVTGYDYNPYKVFEPKDTLYRIISLDTSLLSKDKFDSGKLQICNEKLLQLNKRILDDEKINILIMHHDVNCFISEDTRRFEHWIDDNNIDIVFSGHTHRAAVEIYNDTFREIKQFTAGAIVVDNYAIPSFYICEYDEICEIKMHLFTYADKKEEWVLDNSNLRKFKEGIHNYSLPRKVYKKELQVTIDSTIIDSFNRKYFERYQTNRIYSNKFEGDEEFNSWKIVNSLINIGMSYNKALIITKMVIDKITRDDFYTSHTLLSCFELRNVVYDIIVNYKPQKNETSFEVSCWASRYARKYNRNKEIIVLEDNKSEKLNYSYIKNILLKQVFDTVTRDPNYYIKVTGNELCLMAESVLAFLKNMAIFEIQDTVLLDLVKEYITQKPHPWLVNNNEEDLLKYHKEQAEKHIMELNTSPVICSQIEAAYHICSLFMIRYDKYIGCDEISPIISLTNAVNWLYSEEKFINNKLPMLKHNIVEMKKDLESQSIQFNELIEILNILMENIVDKRDVINEVTQKSITKLWDIFRKLEQVPRIKQIPKDITPVERIRFIFNSATGFIVKAPLRALPTCFWVEPNWGKYESSTHILGKQMLVCVLDKLEDVERIYSYFYQEGHGQKSNEMVFVFRNGASFTPEERLKIRGVFKGKFIRCIFIQEENIMGMSRNENWRNIFYKILCKSKIS